MRSKKAKKRPIQTDQIYKSRVVSRLIQRLMMHGKKSLAESTVYKAMEKLSPDKKEALAMFEQAVKNVMPMQEVRSRRVGGATYQIPMPVKHERSETLAVRWVSMASRARKGKPMNQKLFEELKDAYSGVGNAVKKKDDTHKMAEANRAFSHFRL